MELFEQRRGNHEKQAAGMAKAAGTTRIGCYATGIGQEGGTL